MALGCHHWAPLVGQKHLWLFHVFSVARQRQDPVAARRELPLSAREPGSLRGEGVGDRTEDRSLWGCGLFPVLHPHGRKGRKRLCQPAGHLHARTPIQGTLTHFASVGLTTQVTVRFMGDRFYYGSDRKRTAPAGVPEAYRTVDLRLCGAPPRPALFFARPASR